MADSAGDKKHAPSDRKRQQAREQGQVAKSTDLTSAGLLLAAVGCLWAFGPGASRHLATFIRASLGSFDVGGVSSGDAAARAVGAGMHLAAAVVPILATMMIAAVGVNVVQTGLIFSTTRLTPKLSNVSPLSGVKRIVSLTGLMRLGFGLFKVAVIAAVAYVSLSNDAASLVTLGALSVGQVGVLTFDAVVRTATWIALALLVLAVAEYAMQRWKHEQDLMMTDQEVRDEMKETNGDPQLAARRKQIQRQMMMNRAETEVPGADVVVSNPTELAIAIRYDAATMPAPVVVAKGAGPLAQKIRRVALSNGIPVVERKPLAQALYKTVEVGGEIPADQYQAVAEVLRYVYQLQGRDIPRAG